jgi:hypothetical protein
VLLHEELPAEQRFPIGQADVERMRATMRITSKRLGRVPDEAFGAPVEVLNNVGRIPGLALLENATLLERGGPRRLFMVASVAFPTALGDTDRFVVPRLRELVRRPSTSRWPRRRRVPACSTTRARVRVCAPRSTRASRAVCSSRSTRALPRPASGSIAGPARPRRATRSRSTTSRPAITSIVVELGPASEPTAYRASLVTVARVATSMQAAAPLR